MSNILMHTAPIVRAIHVERVEPGIDLWRASYEGDEWTNEIHFEPPMPWQPLRRELMDRSERRGLPIVLFDEVPAERVA